VSGLWHGTWNSSIFAQNSGDKAIMMDLAQHGSAVTGTLSSTAEGIPTLYDVNGTVNGGSVGLHVAETPENACAMGDFTLEGTLHGDSLVFGFTGSDCLGSQADGEGSATKNPELVGGDITGAWHGVWYFATGAGDVIPSAFTLTVSTFQNTLSGNAVWFHPVIGLPISFQLTVSSNSSGFDLQLASPPAPFPCPSSFEWKGKVSGATLEFSAKGTDCGTGNRSGAGLATK